MTVPTPHFLLYAEAALAADADDVAATRWRFVLRTPAGETAAEAADEEPSAGRERLELLAVIRGLESLDQPSRVTLMTGSRHLQCGLESGLVQWRENNWHWERYGRMTPIKNADLWRRLDRLSSIHTLHCPGARGNHCDDLMPAVHISRPDGRKMRIDQPARKRRKHEIRSPKHETNSKFEFIHAQNLEGFPHSNLRFLDSFRVSWFVLRALPGFVLRALNHFWFLIHNRRSNKKTANSRGVSRAHNRVARRHERPARRPTGPPA
jgi:ribonuclease HI